MADTEITHGLTYRGRKFEFNKGKWTIYSDDSEEPFLGTELPVMTVTETPRESDQLRSLLEERKRF